MPSWDKHAISIFVNRAAGALFIFNLLRSIPTGNVPPKIPPGMWLGINIKDVIDETQRAVLRDCMLRSRGLAKSGDTGCLSKMNRA
ncbi:uncharacterized protein ARMOST_14126 [Armillaria ostoyae]|uniref:Uncharacterized protein n=1 Tax=Armillaria ostoyae TaxID=47428 RepID=A0A284RPM1_ARMOS|nr:uncharacterized protein ARMOST_14126 [Armillaria ostoyae]